ncbi:MAG: preprotein translocase subunit SecE [Planctomycetes bacterium]|nr:preprotein translocase subunit SecE [Planctomycetota bacterium]
MQTAPIQPAAEENGQDRQDLQEAGALGFGIYKFGQGYWVRTMTAIFAGILVLACAGWAWARLSAVSLPVAEYIVPVTKASAALTAGQTVTLLKGKDAAGTATLTSFVGDASSGSAHLKDLKLNPGKGLLDIDRIEAPGASGVPITGIAGRAESIYLFQRIYLQAGVALAIILIGGGVIYRFVATKPTTVDFLIATDGEMKKVNWSTRKIIQDSTSVVIGATFLIAAFIFLCDFLLHRFFMLIDVFKN